MRMGIALGLALLMGISGLVGVSGKAYATSFTSGAICRNYNAAEATDIDYQTWGVQNVNNDPRYVICPITNPFINSNVVSVYVAGDLLAPFGYISCTLTTYRMDGTIVGGQSFTVSAPSNEVKFDQLLSVTGILSENATVLCLLQGNRAATIYGISVQ